MDTVSPENRDPCVTSAGGVPREVWSPVCRWCPQEALAVDVPVLTASPESRDPRVQAALAVPRPACAGSAGRGPTERWLRSHHGRATSLRQPRPRSAVAAQPRPAPRTVAARCRFSQAAQRSRREGGAVNAALLRGVGVTDNYLN